MQMFVLHGSNQPERPWASCVGFLREMKGKGQFTHGRAGLARINKGYQHIIKHRAPSKDPPALTRNGSVCPPNHDHLLASRGACHKMWSLTKPVCHALMAIVRLCLAGNSKRTTQGSHLMAGTHLKISIRNKARLRQMSLLVA